MVIGDKITAYLQRLLRVLAISSLVFFNSLIVVDASEPIVVGVIHSSEYPYADMMKNSYELGLQAKNQAGGINGRPLKLVFADDGGKPKTAEKAVRELVNKSGAVVLVGGYSSKNTIYTAREANRLKIPFLITTAADDRITQRGWEYVYRMNPPAEEYAKGVEGLLLEKILPASMAIVYENSPYGTGGALRMMWFCRENNIPIRKIIPYHKERASAQYFQDLLSPLQEDPPDVIYMVSYLKDAVLLVKKIKELKLDSVLIGGAGGFTHRKFIEGAAGSVEGLLTATLWTHELSYPGTGEYNNMYIRKHSVPPDYHGAEAYASIFVIGDVLERAESFSAENIKKALDETEISTPFGPVKFESYGKHQRQNSLPTMVLQIINNQFEVVWPQDIVTSELQESWGARPRINP